MYRQGVVYIWVNQVGKYAFLNGSETMVIGEGFVAECEDGVTRMVWDTTTKLPENPWGKDHYMWAYPNDLVPRKDTPPGEATIFNLFKIPELSQGS